MRVQIRKKSTISQSDAQNNLQLNVSETKEMIVDFFFLREREGGKDAHRCLRQGEQVKC